MKAINGSYEARVYYYRRLFAAHGNLRWRPVYGLAEKREASAALFRAKGRDSVSRSFRRSALLSARSLYSLSRTLPAPLGRFHPDHPANDFDRAIVFDADLLTY